MHTLIISEESLKYITIITVVSFVSLIIIISLIIYNKTSIRNLRTENKLLKKQIGEMKGFDQKCERQFEIINNKIKILEEKTGEKIIS